MPMPTPLPLVIGRSLMKRKLEWKATAVITDAVKISYFYKIWKNIWSCEYILRTLLILEEALANERPQRLRFIRQLIYMLLSMTSNCASKNLSWGKCAININTSKHLLSAYYALDTLLRLLFDFLWWTFWWLFNKNYISILRNSRVIPVCKWGCECRQCWNYGHFLLYPFHFILDMYLFIKFVHQPVTYWMLGSVLNVQIPAFM